MNVTVLAPYFTPAVLAGGPARTLDALTAAAGADHRVHVVTRDHDLGSTEPFTATRRVTDQPGRAVEYVRADGIGGAVRVARALRRSGPTDLLYLNSLLDPTFSILPLLLTRVRLLRPTRVLLAPRGECSPAALSHRGRRKRLFLSAAKLLRLHDGVQWHASSPDEAGHIRELMGAGLEVIVRENEVDLPRRSIRAPLPDEDRLHLVFLARLVEHKGLHRVLEALVGIDRPVLLDVAGPAQDPAYEQRCRRLTEALPEQVRVRFLGPLDGAESLAAIRRGHAFITASASENFGRTIAEALAMGRPVLAPDTTPWTSRLADGGGSVVTGGGVTEWTRVLREWAGLSPAGLAERAGRAADVYDRWRSSTAPHVFDLLDD